MVQGARYRRSRGSVLTVVVIVLMVLIGFVGLALDWGYVFLTSQELQNAADGAAMAGAQRVGESPSAARAAAIALAAENGAGGEEVGVHDNPDNDADGDVIVGVYVREERSFTPNDDPAVANAVRVLTRRNAGSVAGPLPLFFGPLFGKETAEVSRFAIAIAETAPAGPGIILLKTNGIGLQHSGEGDITVHGSIQINSPYKEALHQSGSYGVLQADAYNVVGKIYDSTPASGLPGDWNEGADPLPDPYAGLPVPNLADHPIRSTTKFAPGDKGPFVLQPGRYIGGIVLGNANYTLQPGIYIIEGGGFKIDTNQPNRVVMDQVMIYNCGTNGGTSNADQFYISGNAIVIWTPVVGGTYDGFGLFQHRDVADKKVQISGNASTDISAIIYAKSAEVQLSGNGGTRVGGGFVAASMQVEGNGDFIVGGDTAGGPGTTKVYLVE